MTVFITHCLKSFLRLEPFFWSGIKRGRLCCVALFLSVAGIAQADTSVDLQALKLERQDTALYMSGIWRFDLPPALEDALLKGITLYFVTEVDINQERWYFYNQRVAHAERHVRLFYQPLTRRWRVNISPQPFSLGGLGMSLGKVTTRRTRPSMLSAASCNGALLTRQMSTWMPSKRSVLISNSISSNCHVPCRLVRRGIAIGTLGLAKHSAWS